MQSRCAEIYSLVKRHPLPSTFPDYTTFLTSIDPGSWMKDPLGKVAVGTGSVGYPQPGESRGCATARGDLLGLQTEGNHLGCQRARLTNGLEIVVLYTEERELFHEEYVNLMVLCFSYLFSKTFLNLFPLLLLLFFKFIDQTS